MRTSLRFYRKGANVIFAVVLAIAGYYILTQTIDFDKITSNAKNNSVEERANLIDALYKHDFLLETSSSGTMNAYALRYRPTDVDLASKYAGLTGNDMFCEDDEEKYCFLGDNGTLDVYKSLNYLEYTADTVPVTDKEAMPLEMVSELAAEQMENMLLPIDYEETVIEYTGGLYTVNFITRLGNLKNYSFTNRVSIDSSGKLIGYKYFFVNYDRISSIKIKSMQQAYYELPTDLSAAGGNNGVESPAVLLDGCELVYYYENSIIQPGYRFTGQVEGGGSFEAFVKAGVYE